ncbi:uncharacterized protein LOC127860320 [Dreissena polymorpha]|uniref:TIR domain-containing protein n=1 Tax=Dreissena polymorpha TaxID=45954 RepID=A0A9D3YV34_DREPO|nr:uncharacterized protein LOC127860320 [Dreissena polymorpha]KAH3704713.1 hypothetical protein DPMN_079775 [Dreissena polymorpha]
MMSVKCFELYCNVLLFIFVVRCLAFTPWIGERSNLLCSEVCKTDKDPERCCACNAEPCWELKRKNDSITCADTISQLAVERRDLKGTRQLINVQNTTLYEIIYPNEGLVGLPENLCEYNDTVVKIDFRNNKLRDINKIKCMRKLDTLHLDNNWITEIKNDTFQLMKNLRVLTLSNNTGIARLPPNVLNIGAHNIFKVDLTLNNFDEIDITNVFRPGTFCEINFSNGHVEKFTNEHNFAFQEGFKYGPGNLLLQNCGVQSFVNFSHFGVDYKDIARYVYGKLSIDNSSFYCDCKLFPFFKDVESFPTYWLEMNGLYGFVCNYPDSMRGVNLHTLLETKRLEQLTCPLEECPSFCTCIDTPSEGRVLVNCSNKGLTEIPDEMPFGYWGNSKIELLIANNSIIEIPNRNYLSRLISVQAQGNYIAHIDSNAILELNAVINIANQTLHFLQSYYSTQDPNKITFGDHPVECTCENLWIGDWIRTNNAFGRLWCQTGAHGKIRAEEVTDQLLSCHFSAISLSFVFPSVSIIGSLLLLMILYCIFRYEFLLLYRKYVKRKNGVSAEMFDVFISCVEEDDEIFLFVQNFIRPILLDEQYSVVTSWNDIMVDIEDRDKLVVEAVSKCRNYVIVLSKTYGRDYNTTCEFDAIWKRFKTDATRQIILINIGYDVPADKNGRRIRAVKRIHKELTFLDKDTRMIERLKRRLGNPSACRPVSPNDILDVAYSEQTPSSDSETNDDDHSHSEAFDYPANKHADSENTMIDSTKRHVLKKHRSVFERLSDTTHSSCNCQYRKCYLHNNSF